MSIGDQFKGLPMGDLIGGPLQAACDAQVNLANATVNFIKTVGFAGDDGNDGWGTMRTAKFQYTKMIQGSDDKVTPYLGELNVPVLSIVNVPSLSVKRVEITFDMEVKSSTFEKKASDQSLETKAKGGGFFWIPKVEITGNVSAHQESTRTTDNSAKYHVEVLAEDSGMPEGLARVLDIMQSAIEPILIGDKGELKDTNNLVVTAKVPPALEASSGQGEKGKQGGNTVDPAVTQNSGKQQRSSS